jgi:ABC-type molybdate transport system substrate-binding protein
MADNNSEMVTVNVGQLPGGVTKVKVPSGSTLQSVLRAASLNSEGWEIRVDNQTTTDLNTIIKANQTVLLLKALRGNNDEMVTVNVGQLPGGVTKVKVPSGSTLQSVLRAASLNSEGWEIRVDNQTTTDLNTIIKANQTVLLLKALRGNC